MRIALSTLSLLWSLVPAVAQSAAPTPEREAMDTTEAAADSAAPAAPAPPETPASPSGTQAGSADSSSPAPGAEAVALRAPLLERLDLGGTVQLKALYHDMLSDRDADKSLSFQLRRFILEVDGGFDPRFGFRGELRVEGNQGRFGVDDAYLYYTVGELVGFKGGKLKRPFSQEALQSSKSLYTVERGRLYHDFLARTTGYAYYDLGVEAYGGFTDDGRSLGYELGVFNGKQNEDPAGDYANQQDEGLDRGFKAKDVVFRLSAVPFPSLRLEAAVSTKAAEDTADPDDFGYAVNTAYEVGLNFTAGRLRLLGEAAWGDNHMGRDSRIVAGSAVFFAFNAMAVWHETYRAGRASELVLQLEGLDPDGTPFGDGHTPNDGSLRYTLGLNYFFTPRVSVLADYGILQPITDVTGEGKLSHDLDLLWRMSF